MATTLQRTVETLTDDERDALIDKAALLAGICPSEDEIEEEARLIVLERLHQLNYAVLTGALSLHEATVDREAVEREAQEEARRTLAAEELMERVIREEGLTVSAEERFEEGRAIAAREGTTLDTVRQYLGEDLRALEHDLLVRKAMGIVCARMLQGA